ncbi:thermonuclease family protein [Agrobacterium tumefaciens]|uniref:thermonuclease family protein n=1 Tax=Agrobacterium tumefaciens TaxID=358 RepID=UPI00287D2C8F|nr:thermonuclease family protein [Agrobacterium tumefaciens]MDS7598453.1 thermonuclease family protein [Agrobacterium tumefaciens]
MKIRTPGTGRAWCDTYRVSMTLAIAIPTGFVVAATNANASNDKPRLTQIVQKCDADNRKTCVVDGDTIWWNGQKIRIADIDTPEISEPRCEAERARGVLATQRLIALINAGPFELHALPGRDQDRYGRKLRVLVRDGRSLGDILVFEGLARTWSGRREPWC